MQFGQLRRREFITLLGGAAAWPFAAYAQQQRGPVRLAFIPLGSSSNRYDRSLVEAFQLGLRRVGLIENQDVALDVVWPGDRPDQAVSEALQRGAELLIPCGSKRLGSGQASDLDHPDRIPECRRPRSGRAGREPLTSGTERNRVQRYPCGIERQAGGCDAGDDQAA